MTDSEILALHRRLVSIPSTSREEGPLCSELTRWLSERGLPAERLGNNIVVPLTKGEGPLLCLCSHLDTVPPCPGWTRPPYEAEVEDGKVFGLGSNDAKASVAAMIGALARLEQRRLGLRLLLALVCEEETGGGGAEQVVPELARRGLVPDAVVVGEPTGLEVAIAQKGLLVLELVAKGQACHAAHARALGAPNALRLLARDSVALDSVDLGAEDSGLGPTTLEPTMASGGSARNALPAEARCILDLRVNPEPGPEELVRRLRAVALGSELRVLSDRLRPCSIAPEHALVRAAKEARPEAQLVGSRTLSDLVFFARAGIPGIKVGPGKTERSHAPDEHVLESELLDGAAFYERLAIAYSRGPSA